MYVCDVCACTCIRDCITKNRTVHFLLLSLLTHCWFSFIISYFSIIIMTQQEKEKATNTHALRCDAMPRQQFNVIEIIVSVHSFGHSFSFSAGDYYCYDYGSGGEHRLFFGNLHILIKWFSLIYFLSHPFNHLVKPFMEMMKFHHNQNFMHFICKWIWCRVSEFHAFIDETVACLKSSGFLEKSSFSPKQSENKLSFA